MDLEKLGLHENNVLGKVHDCAPDIGVSLSDDLVNQLTLNLLINKSQLQKINKKLNNAEMNVNKKTELEIYKHRIEKLFRDMLVNNRPNDLLQDVNSSFDLFISKCIYYFKLSDETELLEKERTKANIDEKKYINNDIKEDIDFELEFEDEDKDEEEEEEEDDYFESGSVAKDEYDTKSYKREGFPLIVNRKYNKKNHSAGVDDIEKLPLNWFEKVRKDCKKNTIIPRRKDDK